MYVAQLSNITSIFYVETKYTMQRLTEILIDFDTLVSMLTV